jgi:8-hydroxy-5-deazaflavin:NADPH oxidoreductase
MKKVGILGSGPVAQSLGKGFLKYGYDVMLGTRDAQHLEDWKKSAGEGAKVGSFEETGKFGELIVLAVKGSAASDVIDLVGPQHLDCKTVIDTTNPFSNTEHEDGVPHFFTTLDESLMERLQHRFPAIHFVKAFNTVNNQFMVNPAYKEGQPSMFICGNNDAAKTVVNEILVQFGWLVEDMGKATSARAIEPLAMLWCIPGFRDNQWTHAFKLLRS